MAVETLSARRAEPIRQFSIFADNKVGRFNDIVMMLAARDIHLMAVCTLDTTDTTVIRLIVDYWEKARDLFREQGLSYSLNEVVVVEIPTEQDIPQVTCALVQTEINIHYVYPLLTRPRGMCGLVLRLEDNELATDVLTRQGIRVLDHHDIAR